MRIIGIKGTNIELTEAIKTYVEERIESLKKLCADFDPSDELAVEVGKTTQHHAKGPFFFAEMQLSLPGTSLRAVEEAEDLYEAIDKVKDQLRRQIADYKDKLLDRSQRGQRPDKE